MAVLIGAGLAGFVALLIVLAVGRRVESGAGRLLVLVAGLAVATAVALGVLWFVVGIPVDPDTPPRIELPPLGDEAPAGAPHRSPRKG